MHLSADASTMDGLNVHGAIIDEGRPREAEYACTHCGSLIGERHKTWMLEHGEWRPTVVGDGRTAGFHLSSLYSPVGWFSWADAAEMYEQARKAPDLMKGFVNTVLGLPFEEEAEAPEWQRLYERREVYRIGVVPEPGLFLGLRPRRGRDLQPRPVR